MNDQTFDFQDPDVRDSQLSNFTQEKSLSALNKAKSLVMAYWHGETLASTKDVCNFYSIDRDTLQKILDRHRTELHADGVRKLEGQELRRARDIFALPSSTSTATVWTPRAILRVGMLLQDNEIAKQVRNILLDQVEQNPNPQQLGLFDHEEDEAPQQLAIDVPTPAEIAATVVLALDPARFSGREIGLAIADAIASPAPRTQNHRVDRSKIPKTMNSIIYGHQSDRGAALDLVRSLVVDRSKIPKTMTPISEFLISKEMTASDLLNLSGTEESAFWGEYAAWKQSALESLRERSKEIANDG